ncbi:carbohydrate porin [Photobacterium makurazakiensis]|uniref:carbohydrate porin n=1 Tax=Photobacterium makurazakiensis TaxID=2910234 RepID=UPI003D0D544E
MKLLPLAVVISTLLASTSIFAEEADSNNDLTFTGYARYGLHYADNGNDYVRADGQMSDSAAGRLGNEANGGEFQFSKGFDGSNGTNWDVVVMLENWWKEDGEYGDIALKKFYAGVSGVFASQPDLYIWAGRDFHQRPQQGINDYFWMSHDGQGAGFYNLNLGGVYFDMGAVGQTADEGTGDSGNYAITTKLHGINLTEDLGLTLYANYGFSSDKAKDSTDPGKEDITAYQVAAVLDYNGHNFMVRYSDNSDTSVFNKTDDLTIWYASLEGAFDLDDRAAIEYLAGYHKYDGDDKAINRTNYTAIVRPTYAWTDVHSTWLEAGYSLVDYDESDENSAWKVTLSQNISFGNSSSDRPMLRFYATVGEAENNVDAETGSLKNKDIDRDTFAVGAMWEAWW